MLTWTSHPDLGLVSQGIWGPREEGLIVQVRGQISAVGPFSGLERELGHGVNMLYSWEELP